MTQLITPAKSHDNKYPKPTPDFGKTTDPIQPLPETIKPYLDKVFWQNDANKEGSMQLPTQGNFISMNNPQVAKLFDISVNESNFNQQTGMCVFVLITDATYPSFVASFALANNPPAFTYLLEPSKEYTFIMTLAKNNETNVLEPVLINVFEKSMVTES